jgi:hypothetical protein
MLFKKEAEGQFNSYGHKSYAQNEAHRIPAIGIAGTGTKPVSAG